MSDKKPLNIDTLSVWAAENNGFADNASVVPLTHSVTYAYPSVEDWQAVGTGLAPGHLYSRSSNPTVAIFEEKMRVLEQAETATAFATGMAAISNTLFALTAPGQRIVTIQDTYGGTGKLFSHFLPRLNIEISQCPADDLTALLSEIDKGCDLLYLETPTNPLLKLLDIAKLSKAAHKAAAIVVVDNTLASPVNQQPLKLGADIVVHSATKYIGGHSDVLGGVACGSKALIDKIFQYREITGASLDPNAAFMLIRGLKTLSLRVKRHNSNAQTLVEFLKQHPKIEQVHYPALTDHPQHALAKQQMSGFGGVFSFTLKTDFDGVKRFLNQLELAHLAASLGSVDTLIGPPSVTSHAEFSAAERKAMGIDDNLVRCAVGIEDPDDLIADFSQALEQV
jgi:cystathionine gamma-synthase